MYAQLAAIALWMREFKPDEMPFVAIGLDLPSGNKLRDQWSHHTPFYRRAESYSFRDIRGGVYCSLSTKP
jgi:hypothetical protein